MPPAPCLDLPSSRNSSSWAGAGQMSQGKAGGSREEAWVHERSQGCPASWFLQARDRKVAGDVEAARRFSSKARCYNALATAGSVVLPLLLAALVVTGVLHLSKLAQDSVGFFSYQFNTSDHEDK